ncbi:hypothetical protein BIU97_08315 [Curtobacterium sp. MCBA15_009]|uniref:hypothetical protein n=1 Tax=Curtobacterium sp. MCBA15_009 TaxID=1898737 RepID=UPI0008DE016C|nr:hypothetical protein [Curtobacterium sp. MCBA15_009]OII10882.1 hypothetical protein BIU97_08315 [Curtobacterium sp. MCBA15_009]
MQSTSTTTTRLLAARWSGALITLGGLAATVGAFFLFGAGAAAVLALATTCFAWSGPSVVGTPTTAAAAVDPHEVRRYRQAHPGTTVSEAAAAVGRR